MGDIRLDINQTIWNTIGSKHIRIWFFAKLTFELFPAVWYQVGFFFLCHLLFEPILQALVMNISHWAWTLTTVEKWILSSRGVVPTNLTLNIIRGRWIDDTTINFDNLFFKFLVKGIEWSIMLHLNLFSWCNVMFTSTLSVVMRLFMPFLFDFISYFFWDFINLILFLGTIIITSSVIFYVKLYSSKFYNIASI